MHCFHARVAEHARFSFQVLEDIGSAEVLEHACDAERGAADLVETVEKSIVLGTREWVFIGSLKPIGDRQLRREVCLALWHHHLVSFSLAWFGALRDEDRVRRYAHLAAQTATAAKPGV